MTDQNTIAQTLDRLVTAAERIGNSAIEHAPQALETVGAFLQMRAIIDLSIAGFFFVATPIAAYTAIKKIVKWRKNSPNYDRYDDEREIPCVVGVVTTGVLAFILWGTAFLTVIDTNKIISATSPQNALMVAAAQRIQSPNR